MTIKKNSIKLEVFVTFSFSFLERMSLKKLFLFSLSASAKVNIATEVIANNLGRSWRKFGRKLGLTEVQLESIAKKHPTDLMETAVELIQMWRKAKPLEGENELIKALRDSELNLTADKVEARLRDQ